MALDIRCNWLLFSCILLLVVVVRCLPWSATSINVTEIYRKEQTLVQLWWTYTIDLTRVKGLQIDAVYYHWFQMTTDEWRILLAPALQFSLSWLWDYRSHWIKIMEQFFAVRQPPTATLVVMFLLLVCVTCYMLLLLLSFTTPSINLLLITIPGEGIYHFYVWSL